jgi:hypothetical protein
MIMKEPTLIAFQRLANQLIANPTSGRLEEVVYRLGVIQAQDYAGALWAVGLRTANATEADVEQAITERKFVRTWPARGTLHFVAAQDVRWMLALLARRAIQASASRHRQLGLDEDTFTRSREEISHVLRNGNRMTREALYQALESAHISTEGQRGIHILGRLAQEGLICFGPRDGKQQVFVLLEEWVPAASALPAASGLPGVGILPRDQALAELARRYFTSHGPATVRDFAWWSGLTASDSRAGLEMASPHLAQEEINGQTYWGPHSVPGSMEPSPSVHLLPAFEEYLLGYTDRSAVLEPGYAMQMVARNGMISPIIVIDGQVVGTWKRALKKEAVVITPEWFTQPGEAQQQAFCEAAGRYGAFLGLEVVLV